MKRDQIRTGIVTGRKSRCILIITGLVLFVFSCISPFKTDYKGQGDLLVVDGSLIKGYDTQEIRISRTADISESRFYPVEGCNVRIEDDSGNGIVFTEDSPGKYVAKTDDAFLNYDSQYKLIFSTPSGENYESGYQKLLSTAPVDSVYSVKETHYIPESESYIFGLQFYIDLDAPDDASRYYRWEVKETWEVHASHKINGYYDGTTIYFNEYVSSDSLYYCWNTQVATGIYTYSTTNLSHNVLKQVPLHFKADNSLDLTIKYCATVRQFALNEDAYNYWHQKEAELNESGQIYTTQPSQVKSNIYNINNPEETVLGFFWVSSVTEKHHFEKNPFWSSIIIGPEKCTGYGTCGDSFNEKLLASLYSIANNTRNFPEPPVYMYYVQVLEFICIYFSKDECIDCRKMGGTIRRPDFWQ